MMNKIIPHNRGEKSKYFAKLDKITCNNYANYLFLCIFANTYIYINVLYSIKIQIVI